MEEEKGQLRDILPNNGIWTVEDFAKYLGVNPDTVQQKLSDMGVKVFSFSRKYRNKMFRLEDIK